MSTGRIRFGYAGVRVRNLRRSLRFYRGLGFRILRRGRMEHGGQWVHLQLGRSPQRLELNYYPNGNPYATAYRTGSELDHLGFFVGDVDAAVHLSRRVGGTLKLEISETRERLAFVADPDGIWVEFVGPPKPRRGRARRRSSP